jgi:Domain of unknown function (DUF4132)
VSDLRPHQAPADLPLVGAATQRSQWLAALVDQLRALAAPLNEARAAAAADPAGYDHVTYREGYDEWLRKSPELHAQIGDRLRGGPGDERRAAVIYLLAADEPAALGPMRESYVHTAAQAGGWSAEELRALLPLLLRRRWLNFELTETLGAAIAAARHLDEADRRDLAPLFRQASGQLENGYANIAQRRKYVRQIAALLRDLEPARLPGGLLLPGDNWAPPLLSLIGAETEPAVVTLILHLAALGRPHPSRRWRSECLRLLEPARAREVVLTGLHGLAGCEPAVLRSALPLPREYRAVVCEQNAPVARGVVWAAALAGGDQVTGDLEAVALRTGETRRDLERELKIAGAAIGALGESEDPAAPDALWRLDARISDRALRQQIDIALGAVAARRGMTRPELIERGVPDHGLGAGGALSRQVGGYTATVAIEDARLARLSLRAPDGRLARGVPASLKAGFPAETAELAVALKQVRATLSAERGRLERLLCGERAWPLAEWQRYYLGHPVTGAVASRLIWELDAGDGRPVSVLPAGGGLAGADGASVGPPDHDTRVRLWHPAGRGAAEIEQWRSAIEARQLRQPFKQAFREVYRLTPGEERTGSYSSRFAGHIVAYRRLYALFTERGWRSNFLGSYDGGDEGDATADLAGGAWRAHFRHENADLAVGGHAVSLAATGPVRFERRDGGAWTPVPLAEVPPLVFSEAMRDVDLFVSLTSIGADPDWADHGAERYGSYWREFASAELTPSAQVRRAALERLIPRLTIADRCALAGRYLEVRGRLRSYRIHIGSGNVLMEPGSSYLCIVPGRAAGPEKVFLPFEEDGRLALILSKAFLLARDDEITDGTITSQIRGNA